jgi:hypothetical protein
MRATATQGPHLCQSLSLPSFLTRNPSSSHLPAISHTASSLAHQSATQRHIRPRKRKFRRIHDGVDARADVFSLGIWRSSQIFVPPWTSVTCAPTSIPSSRMWSPAGVRRSPMRIASSRSTRPASRWSSTSRKSGRSGIRSARSSRRPSRRRRKSQSADPARERLSAARARRVMLEKRVIRCSG